jgi:hypothetical protein
MLQLPRNFGTWHGKRRVVGVVVVVAVVVAAAAQTSL